MGWASGSEVMSKVISSLMAAGLNDEGRKTVYRTLVPALEDMDWDTQNECEDDDPAFAAVMQELHPDWYEDEEEDEEE